MPQFFLFTHFICMSVYIYAYISFSVFFSFYTVSSLLQLSGKSTMMKIIHGIENPRSGYAEFCSNSVVTNYFAQNQADALDLEMTVLDTLQECSPSDVSLTDLRALLGQFMFKGDDVHKKISVLSGGEKARVALCKMMLTPANLLLLDEVKSKLFLI
jgi:ATP-binding cassette, subfamily F, member 3